MLDVVVLTTGNYRFSSGVEITVDKLTGVVTNCSEDENIYQGQQFDVVIGRSLNILLKINHVFRILHLLNKLFFYNLYIILLYITMEIFQRSCWGPHSCFSCRPCSQVKQHKQL